MTVKYEPQQLSSSALVPLTKKTQLLPADSHRAKVWNYFGHKLAKLSTLQNKRKKLLDVVARGDLAEVMEQLSLGADVNVKSALGQSPLYVAAMKGFHQIALLLLERGAHVNDVAIDGSTPLFAACEANKERVAKVLLAHKARVDIPVNSGLYPLHIAAKKGYFELVQLLLQHRAKCDVVMTKLELTPLMLACMRGHPEIVEALLDAGADPYAEDYEGNTPLHFACADGNYRVTYLLMTAGADPDMPNAHEDTAFDIAAKHGHAHVQYLLETTGMGGGKTVEEMDQAFVQDKQLSEALARNRPEIADIIVKNRIKYAKFFALGSLTEDVAVEVFNEPAILV